MDYINRRLFKQKIVHGIFMVLCPRLKKSTYFRTNNFEGELRFFYTWQKNSNDANQKHEICN